MSVGAAVGVGSIVGVLSDGAVNVVTLTDVAWFKLHAVNKDKVKTMRQILWDMGIDS